MDKKEFLRAGFSEDEADKYIACGMSVDEALCSELSDGAKSYGAMLRHLGVCE